MNKIIKNASWIIFCKIVQVVLNLVVSMITARYLGPSNYGIINYAASIVTFFVPVVQLGINCVLVQMFVERPEENGKIIGTSTIATSISSLLGVVCIWAFTSVANYGETDTILVCTLYSVSMFFQMTEMIQYWYQSKLLSKYVSIVSLISQAVVSIYKIYIILSGKNIYWFAIVNSFDFLIISIGLFYIYRKIGGQKLSFSFALAKEMIVRSRHFIISGLMVSIFTQTDRIMLKLMVDDAESGFYSAALTCSGMLVFLATAIIDSMRPILFENKKSDQFLYHKNTVRLYSILIYVALCQSLALTAFSEPIIQMFFGEDYLPSIAVLRIISWCSIFSYLGGARGIWFLSEGKEKYLLLTNSVGAIMNIILNLVFIPMLGACGAALTSLLTQFLTNFVLNFVMKPLRENGKWMAEALNPKVLLDIIKKVRI